jgi:hypothetical protein
MKPTLLFSAVLSLFTVQLHAQGTCSTALPIGLGQYTAPVLTGQAPTIICAGTATPAAYGLWYKFTATLDTTVQLTTHVDGFPDVDTRFHVYTGTCGSLQCHAGDDDSGPNYSSIDNFNVVQGVTYYIAFDSYWTPNGFTFQLSEVFVPTPPVGVLEFTNVPLPGAGYVMGVVDMNGDGLDDAVTPNQSSVTINYQLEAGGYSTATIGTSAADNTPSWSMAAGDIDGNGYNDLLYGGGSGATFMIANSDGTAYTELSFAQYIFSQRTNFVDINADGHLDAFVCHDVDANVYFMNDGNNNLSFQQGALGTSCGNYGSLWTDYDNDGMVDCFVAKCGCDPVDLLMRNNGNVGFTSMAASLGLADDHQSWSSAWGDFDNDGDMDVLIGASSSGYHKLMSNNGNGTFTNVTAGSGMDVFTGQSIEWTTHDFDNDGFLDILGGGAMHFNNGNMTFSSDVTAPYNGPIGDLDNDGFLDIVNGSSAQMNQGNENNWIRIYPIGVESNRNGIGARVSVTSALGTQIRDVKSGDGFEFMSTIVPHFGLGADTEVEEVRITWPSGVVDVITDPPVNGTLTVVEGLYTGIGEQAQDGFSVYPNPAVDVVTLRGAGLNEEVALYDMTGKLVLTGRTAGGTLNVGNLLPGVYQVVLTNKGSKVRTRFTKQ